MNREPFPQPESLDGRAVHLWMVSLTGKIPPGHPVFGLASPAERARADRREPLERDRFLLAHGLLRLLLGKYLGISPGTIAIETSQYGKPCLAGQPVEFNLSHTPGMVLFGFAREGAVGVDIERKDREADYLGVSHRYFSAEEYEVLSELAGTEFQDGFFTLWTRKEALSKAIGRGLRIPLRTVRVNGQAPLRTSFEGQQWHVEDIAVPGYCAAFAVPFEPEEVRLFSGTDADLGALLSEK